MDHVRTALQEVVDFFESSVSALDETRDRRCGVMHVKPDGLCAPRFLPAGRPFLCMFVFPFVVFLSPGDIRCFETCAFVLADADQWHPCYASALVPRRFQEIFNTMASALLLLQSYLRPEEKIPASKVRAAVAAIRNLSPKRTLAIAFCHKAVGHHVMEAVTKQCTQIETDASTVAELQKLVQTATGLRSGSLWQPTLLQSMARELDSLLDSLSTVAMETSSSLVLQCVSIVFEMFQRRVTDLSSHTTDYLAKSDIHGSVESNEAAKQEKAVEAEQGALEELSSNWEYVVELLHVWDKLLGNISAKLEASGLDPMERGPYQLVLQAVTHHHVLVEGLVELTVLWPSLVATMPTDIEASLADYAAWSCRVDGPPTDGNRAREVSSTGVGEHEKGPYLHRLLTFTRLEKKLSHDNNHKAFPFEGHAMWQSLGALRALAGSIFDSKGVRDIKHAASTMLHKAVSQAGYALRHSQFVTLVDKQVLKGLFVERHYNNIVPKFVEVTKELHDEVLTCRGEQEQHTPWRHNTSVSMVSDLYEIMKPDNISLTFGLKEQRQLEPRLALDVLKLYAVVCDNVLNLVALHFAHFNDCVKFPFEPNAAAIAAFSNGLRAAEETIQKVSTATRALDLTVPFAQLAAWLDSLGTFGRELHHDFILRMCSVQEEVSSVGSGACNGH